MSKKIAILLLVINLMAGGVGLWKFCKKTNYSEVFPSESLKEGWAAYLTSASTPIEMESRSAHLAEVMMKGSRVVEASRDLVYRMVGYIILLTAINVIGLGTGLWLSRRHNDA